jgi:NADH:ubiquinone oxidoreductase subunit 6 (subunit J)
MLSSIQPLATDWLTPAMFYLFAGTTAAAAIGVVACRNIVRSAVCLLFTLAGIAGLYFLLNAEFLAAVQLVVYTGGILTLIIFGVMLTSTSPFSRFEPKPGEVVVAISLAAIVLWALILVSVKTPFAQSTDSLNGSDSIALMGQLFLGDYVVPFELASVLLLVVMIGAAYLARGKRPASDVPKNSERN